MTPDKVSYTSGKVYRREFDSWEAFVTFADTAPRAPYADKSRHHASTENHSLHSWDLDAGRDGAFKLAREGWSDGRARFVDGMAEAAARQTTLQSRRSKFRRDVAGARPCVPAYLAGSPRSMYRETRVTKSRPVVSIVVNAFVSALVDAEQIMNRGVAIASWVDAAEAAGTRCEIILAWPCTPYGKGKSVDTRIVLKRTEDSLDADRLAFAFAHPGCFRRVLFALAERDGTLANTYGLGYGHPTDYSDVPADVVYFDCLSRHNLDAFATVEAAVNTINTLCDKARDARPVAEVSE